MKILIVILLIAAVGGLFLLLPEEETLSVVEKEHELTEEDCDRYHEAKKVALERILGPMHEYVAHAFMPFQIGGAMDMYLFANGIPGTGFATMELIEADGSGPEPNRLGTYEFVAFTKHKMPSPDGKAVNNHFDSIERRFCGIFTTLGRYSYDTALRPGETCEGCGPEGERNICLIIDEYAPNGIPFEIDGKRHCLLLLLEVFPSEMEYARKNGNAAVIEKLKEAGHYPYSDLDRKPVY